MVDVKSYLLKLKELNLRNPVLVGFGIKDRQTFEEACTNGNGAIIGSAFIQAINEKKGDQLAVTISEFITGIIR